MAQHKKWEIPGLKDEKRFEAAALRILSSRLTAVLDWIRRFQETSDSECLHQLRIAVRRLRYPLETMVSQLPRKSAIRFIGDLDVLQDAAGGARDLDVLLERLRHDDARFGWMLPPAVYDDLRVKRDESYRDAEEAIALFLVSPTLYDFRAAIGGHPEGPDGSGSRVETFPTDSDPNDCSIIEETGHDHHEENPHPR